jgi:hypothetical protein
MNAKKIEEIMKFMDEAQREAKEDYLMITQLRSSLFFIDKSLEQKQKSLENVSEKLKNFFNMMISPDHEENFTPEEKTEIID